MITQELINDIGLEIITCEWSGLVDACIRLPKYISGTPTIFSMENRKYWRNMLSQARNCIGSQGHDPLAPEITIRRMAVVDVWTKNIN